jgi:glutamate formiminotransferase/formiminotetrahydrofolate cyclodeaminase
MAPMLIDLKIAEFLDRLADRSPTPGGGSAGALAGAMGASLGLMALRFSKLEESAPFERALETVRSRLIQNVDEDARAYDRVSAAFKLPKGTDAEKSSRGAAIQEATRGAARVPLEGMRQIRVGMTALKAFGPQCNRNLVSDLAASILLFAAGAEILAQNVVINVKSLKDPGELPAETSALRAEIEALRADLWKLTEAM